MITTAAFIPLLKAHDWGFDQLRGDRFDRGLAYQRKLLYLCQQQPELFRLYNYAQNRFIRSLPFDFQSFTGITQVKVEKQHTQTQTSTMKDILQSIFDMLIKPLIDAIDRNTAAQVSGSVGYAPEAQPPSTPAPEPKPVKAKTAKPAPEPEPEAPTITEARLKATVMTLPNEGKLKLKAYFVKKFGYNTMAEIAEENRADIHAAAVKIGAVDTDPDAPAEDVDLG